MTAALIYDALRTPRGKGRDGGALHAVTPSELVQTLITAALDRSGFDGSDVSDVILGCVTQIGEQGGNIAKVAALCSDLPDSVSGMTINRYCTSGLDAANVAAMKILSGTDELVLAGGVESMSRVEMLSDNASFYSDPDVVRQAGFVPMGLGADLVASLDGISREQCDAYAVRSQQRAAAALGNGYFGRSLVPVLNHATGTSVTEDECVRGSVTLEKLATFEPLFADLAQRGYEAAFKEAYPRLGSLNHVHHPGNSPAIVDGASLLVIGSEATGTALGLRPRARIVAMTNVSSDRLIALTGGIHSAKDVLHKAGMTKTDVDLVEFNEAFAAVAIKFLRDTGWSDEQVNVNGGAIALGHAMGATGATLLGTLLDELERRDLDTGLVAVSGAAGIGAATVIERV